MMLGPMKKKMITAGVVCFIIPCVIFGVVFSMYSNAKKTEIADLNTKMADTICLRIFW